MEECTKNHPPCQDSNFNAYGLHVFYLDGFLDDSDYGKLGGWTDAGVYGFSGDIDYNKRSASASSGSSMAVRSDDVEWVEEPIANDSDLWGYFQDCVDQLSASVDPLIISTIAGQLN